MDYTTKDAGAPAVSFVKRAVLQSEDGGNTYNVEVEDLIKDGDASGGPRVSLYDQLAKTITERRSQRVEGRPDELSIEDQEFVDKVMEQKNKEQILLEEEAKEFKRQRVLAIAETVRSQSATNDKDVLVPPSVTYAKVERKSDEQDFGEIVVVKRKKKVNNKANTASTN